MSMIAFLKIQAALQKSYSLNQFLKKPEMLEAFGEDY
jgi:hypothetical protein